MIVVGITGKAGSGKSLLARALEDRGATRISLDEIGHEVLEKVKDQLVQEFGSSIVSDGTVDRTALSSAVFSSDSNLATLNNLTHPLIRERVLQQLSVVDNSLVVIEGALLFDIGLAESCNTVVWVKSPEAISRERLLRRGMEEQKVRSILRLHKDLEKYKDRCDVIIANDSTPENFVCRFVELSKEWRIL